MEKRLPSTQNQWLLFSLLQRPPVICNEYKAHIVAHKTQRSYTSSLCVLPLRYSGRVTNNPAGDWAKLLVSCTLLEEIWLSVCVLSLGACLQPSPLSPNKTWVGPTGLQLSLRCKVYYCFYCIHCAVPANQTRQPRVWMKHHPSSNVVISISKVANKCLFS